MGGEKFLTLLYHISLQGSPPRGRGKVFGLVSHTPCFGITPAWAGKSLLYSLMPPLMGDHPRVGGEKHLRLLDSQLLLGSPPRGRGKEPSSRNRSNAAGITPAWAGKRAHLHEHVLAVWDHPRVGGEKPNRILWDDFKKGSPPRGRGKVMLFGASLNALRITPAWAGKSCGRAAPRAQKGDHPRVGGEKPRCRYRLT